MFKVFFTGFSERKHNGPNSMVLAFCLHLHNVNFYVTGDITTLTFNLTSPPNKEHSFAPIKPHKNRQWARFGLQTKFCQSL